MRSRRIPPGWKADDCRDLSQRRLATVTVHAASLRRDAGPSRRAAGSHARDRSPGRTLMSLPPRDPFMTGSKPFSFDPTEFAGKRALVTRGTKGLGEAIVRLHAGGGA